MDQLEGRHCKDTQKCWPFCKGAPKGPFLQGLRALAVVSRAYKCQIFKVCFLLLDNEPMSGSHFSSFLHISPLNNIMAEIQ
jgi:hypothetical protein